LSHSSTGEDVILDWIIKKEHWFYVDIGWFDPIYWNNTYLFYKKGWNGINVEPNISGFKKFTKKRPKDINLQIAAWRTNWELIFHRFDYAAISTCDPLAVQRYTDAWHKVIETYTVPIWTLEKIFETYGKGRQVDILSVDVEWFDMDVLESNNWEKYTPSYIILETVEYAKNWIDTWSKQNDIFDPYLQAKWYVVIAETGINTIYKKL
jgi:FkbM family methyltransferase